MYISAEESNVNVLLVNYEYPGAHENCGGGGHVTRSLLAALTDRGHDVRVATDGGRSHDDDRVVGTATPRHYALFPLRIAPTLRRWASWADVVHGHFSIPSSLGLPWACRDGTPYVVSVMGADVFDPTRFRALRPATRPINRFVVSRAAAVTAPSADMASRTQRATGRTPAVVHYGIDDDAREWRPRDDPTAVLTVARLVERKNLFRAIQAVQQLRRDGHDISYTIVGTGPRLARLRWAAIDREWLSLPGYVEDLESVYAAHDVFLLPSLHEAFGIVQLEALRAGLPVVATDTGGQRDVLAAVEPVRRPGCLAPDASVDAIARALGCCLAFYTPCQRRTKAFVETHFSQAGMAESFETVYERAVSDGR